MQSDSSYHLDSDKLDDVVEIVEGELEVLRSLVRSQQKAAPRLEMIVWSFFVGLILILMLGVHEWVSYETWRILLPVYLVVYVAACLMIGWKEMSATVNLRVTQRSLGLTPDKFIRFVGWNELWQRLVRGFPMAVLFIGGFFLANWAVERRNAWIVDFGFTLVAISFIGFLHLVLRRTLMLSENRLKDAEQLRLSLISQRDTARETGVTISFSEVVYKEIARIERALVNLERQRAIKANANKRRTQLLPVQQSVAVVGQKASLEPPIRIKVQTCIDELSTDPRPANAQAGPDGKWRLEVPETRFQISYAFAEHPQRILIEELSENPRNTNIRIGGEHD